MLMVEQNRNSSNKLKTVMIQIIALPDEKKMLGGAMQVKSPNVFKIVAGSLEQEKPNIHHMNTKIFCQFPDQPSLDFCVPYLIK